MKPIGIVALIVATGIVVGGGVYMWQKSESNTQQNSLNSQIATLQSQKAALEKQAEAPIPATNPATTSITPSTTNQTYKSDAYGLSFKYPNDWKFEENKPDNNWFRILLDKTTQFSQHKGDLPYPISISVYSNLQTMIDQGLNPEDKKFTSVEEYAKYYQPRVSNDTNKSTFATSITTTTLGGQPAYKTTILGVGSFTTILAQTDKHFYLVETSGIPINGTSNPVVQEIIDSIVFTK